MATVELTGETFEKTVLGDGIVIVDFWADWCGPCKAFAPIFEASSEQNPDVVHGKLDTEAERGLASALEIQAIPTLMVFRDGIGLFRQVGALPAPALADVITQARALDMDAVRAEIAQQQEQEKQGGTDAAAAEPE